MDAMEERRAFLRMFSAACMEIISVSVSLASRFPSASADALSMPSIVGKNGVETGVPIELSREEQKALRESADTLRAVIADVFGEE